MKRTRYIRFVVTLLLFVTSAGLCVFSQESDTLRIATYNIRVITSSDTENRSWANRKQYLGDIIKTNKFDIFGVQEIANATQQSDLMAYLPEYSIYWKGRNNTAGTTGERCAIVYRTSRFQILQDGWFFLSETPDTYSIGWDAEYPRICIWVKMYDTATEKIFYFFNTHFDHAGTTARTESAKLVMAKINQLTENVDLPVFFVGDLNFSTENGTIPYAEILEGGLRDSRSTAPTSKLTGPVGTYNGWNMVPSNYTESKRIDYVFVNNKLNVFSYSTIDTKFVDDTYPSDHFPVMIRIKIEESTPWKEDITLTETYANVVQTSSAGAGTKWNGDYFEWSVLGIRRGTTDLFYSTTIQAGWFRAGGYIYSSQPVEGGIKNLSFDWAQIYQESTVTFRMMILIDDVAIDSIIRDGSLGRTTQVYNNNTINSKKNAVFRINNSSYEAATGALLSSNGRFYLGDITWTPYLWYLTKSITINKGAKYTNTDMIDNLNIDMDAPTYTSSNPAVATIDATTGEVTGVNAGTAIITATTGLISTTYQLTVNITSGTKMTSNSEFLIYPTQISEVLHIKTTEKRFSVKVFNQTGSLIATYKNMKNIPFSNLAAGMYIIRIQSESSIDSIHKVLKR